jgi:hypothetical protein
MPKTTLEQVLDAGLNAVMRERVNERDEQRDKTPSNAKPFPEKKVGDFVYFGTVDEGVAECIIIAKDAEHRCLTIPVRNDLVDFSAPYTIDRCPTVACDHCFATPQEVLLASVANDIDYHGRHLDHSNKVRQAMENNEDWRQFQEGLDD